MWGFNSTFAFLFSSFTFMTPLPDVITEIGAGKLEGTTSLSRNGRTIYEFVGIPYSLPPVGKNRFKPPVPWNETWEGIRDAKVYGSRCVQFHLIARYLTGDEDCLFLNVYTHKFQQLMAEPINETELKPVMVYFHGGLWMQGHAGFYQPNYFLSENIVFVTVQYRLGAFGFLNLFNDDIRGNMGLKDQVAALRWIRYNINVFGGDPNKVTLMGESAGAASVHFHLLSPMSRGLFHRAISQSGTALVIWATQDHPYEQAKNFAQKFNCSRETKAGMAECLRNIDAEDIGNMQRDAADILHDRYALFGPTIEYTEDNDTETFLSEKPEVIIKSGHIAKVPYICGMNSEEGLIYAAPMIRNDTIRNALNANWTYWAPILFRFDDEPNKVEIANRIREYYNLTTEIGMDTISNFTMFLTDRVFFEGIHHTLNLHRGQHPVYPYIYTYRGIFSFGKLILGMSFNLPILADALISSSWNWISSNVLRNEEIDYGTSHGDELPLMFKMRFHKEHTEESKDFEMSRTLVQMWTTFAKDGVPPEVQGIIWPSLSNREEEGHNTVPMKFLKFDKTFELVDEPFNSRAEFWKSLNLLPYKIEKLLNPIELDTIPIGFNSSSVAENEIE